MSSLPPTVRIRAATLDDAAAIVPLLAELGYQLGEVQVRDNIRRLTNGATDEVWIAERGREILGLVSVHLTPLFHKPGNAGRITSLVVRAGARSQGIGNRLVAEAEAFCWRAGCDGIEVTSADHRVEAHRFYERLGYAVRSRRFFKQRV